MWWAPLLLVGLLLGASRRRVELTLGRTYRFVLRVDGTRSEVDGPALVELLESEGATDVLVTKGAPQLAVYSYVVPQASTVELGTSRPVTVAGVRCALFLLEVTEIA
jgi:hypothetical protein